MRWFLVVAVVLICTGVACADGGFDDWYGSLEARSAFLYDIELEEYAQSVTAPVVGWRALSLEAGGSLSENENGSLALDDKVLLGISYSVGSLQDLGVNMSWAKYFTINPMIWAKADWKKLDVTSWGLGVNLLDLSFDDGNAAKQKEDAQAGRAR